MLSDLQRDQAYITAMQKLEADAVGTGVQRKVDIDVALETIMQV